MRYLSLLLVIIITGCVSTRPAIQVNQNVKVDSWNMNGRLAASVDHDGGSASFIWNKKQDEHSIELFGPLGSGRVLLSQSNGQASIQDEDSRVMGDNLEQVLFDNIGWLVPFEAINYWIMGKPQPNNDYQNQKYEGDNLISFEQLGWYVDYNKFKTFSQITIPSKITILATSDHLNRLSRELNRDIDKVSVKLIVKEFSGS